MEESKSSEVRQGKPPVPFTQGIKLDDLELLS
jgi:hypothetical protein